MDRLTTISEACKGGVVVLINGHKNMNESVADYTRMMPDGPVKDRMIEEDSIIEIIIEMSMYKDSPVGFYEVAHYDLDLAIEEAVALVKMAESY